MPDTKAEDKRAADSKAAKDKAIAEAKANQKKAIEGRDAAAEAMEPVVEGYDVTEPGQEEVVAGSVEHQQVLSSFPNATSYGPDVNVVVPPEPPPPDPPSTLSGAAATAQHDTRAVTKAGSRSSREA
jgi:hypothetical protein